MSKQPAQPQVKAPSTELKEPNPVSFRLDPHTYLGLQQRAAREGASPNLWARTVLLHALTDEGADTEVLDRIAALESQVATLQQNLRYATEAILLAVVTRKTMAAEDVKAWVNANLKTGFMG